MLYKKIVVIWANDVPTLIPAAHDAVTIARQYDVVAFSQPYTKIDEPEKDPDYGSNVEEYLERNR